MRRLSWGLLAVLLIALACKRKDEGGPAGGKTLASIEVQPPAPSTIVGGRVAFHAIGTYDDQSIADVTEDATWSSSGTATISNEAGTRGIATASSVGTATIRATIGSVEGQATLTVTAAAVTAIRIDPSSAAVASGGTTELRCLGTTDVPGAPEVDLTGSATWSSSPTAVATVSSGVVKGVSAGTAQITATYETLVAEASVEVRAPGASVLRGLWFTLPQGGKVPVGPGEARAFAWFSDGRQREVTPFASFESTATGTLAFRPGGAGAFDALLPGVTTVTVRYQGNSASAAVSVVENGIAYLVLSPTPSELFAAGDYVRVRATAYHLDGTAEDVTAQATWTSDAPQNVSVVGGLLTAQSGSGLAMIDAAYGGVSSGLLVEAMATTATSLYAASPITLIVGQTKSFAPSLTLPGNRFFSVADTAAVSIGDPSIIELIRYRDGAGTWVYYHGLAPGQTTVTISAGGLTKVVDVTVTAPTAVIVTLEAIDYAYVGSVGWARAKVANASGNAFASDLVTWTSTAPSVAEVVVQNGYAYLHAYAPGTTQIGATYGGVRSSSKSITVLGPPSMLEISSFEMASGTSGCPRAIGHWGGVTLDIAQYVTWSAADPNLIAVVPDACLFAGATGTTVVTAQADVVTASAQAKVTEPLGPGPEPESVAIIPPAGATGHALPPGHTARLSLRGTLPNSNITRALREGVTWTSSDPAVAAFSSDPARAGELTALASGTTVVTASYAPRYGPPLTATVQVRVAPITTLLVFQSTVSTEPGVTTSLPVTGWFDTGTGTSFSESVGPWLAWTTNAPEVARGESDEDGSRIVALTAGSATATATLGGASLDVNVTVLEPSVQALTVSLMPAEGGQALAPVATAIVADGLAVDVTDLATWSADGTVFTVSGTPPVVTVTGGGTGTVTATLRGLSGSATAWMPYPNDQVAPNERTVWMAPGWSEFVFFRAYGSYGSADLSPRATCASSDPAVATAQADPFNGVRIDAHAPGRAVLTLSAAGRSTQVLVNVLDGVRTFVLSPFEPWLDVHQRLGFRDLASGNMVEALHRGGPLGGAVAWTSSDPAIVAVLQSGGVEATGAGVALVSASTERYAWAVPLIVSNVATRSVSVLPEALPLPMGTRYELRVFARYEDGEVADMTDHVQWTTSDASIADLDPVVPGVVVAKQVAGVANVRAQLGTTTAECAVTVF